MQNNCYENAFHLHVQVYFQANQTKLNLDMYGPISLGLNWLAKEMKTNDFSLLVLTLSPLEKE